MRTAISCDKWFMRVPPKPRWMFIDSASPRIPLTSVVLKIILKHLGLWDVKRKPRPVANAPPIDIFPAYDEQPGPSADDYIRDPAYPAEAYF